MNFPGCPSYRCSYLFSSLKGKKMPRLASCKNGKCRRTIGFSGRSHVVPVWVRRSEVLAGCEAGKLLKLVRHMRLVAIAARQGDIRPIDPAALVRSLHHLQKTLQPAKEFGRRSDLLCEKLAEASAAKTRLVRKVDHTLNMRRPPQSLKGVGDCRVQ